jgi:hypothetical protein
MNINIYFGERSRVLHLRLVTIENYQHMQRVIDVPNVLNNIKSHVISLLGINHFTHKVILEGGATTFCSEQLDHRIYKLKPYT